MEADDVEAPYPAGDPQARVSALAPATPPTEPQGRPDAGLPGPGHEPVPPPRHFRPRQRMRRMDSTRRSTCMDLDWAPRIDQPKNGFDVSLHTSDVAEARRWFEQLS